MANSDFYISSGAVTITPNIKSGDPHYVGISVVSGAAIRVRNKLTKKDGTIVNVGYSASLDYRKWTLTGGNTNVMSDYDKALNIYARLDAATSGTSGIVMLSAMDHDVYESTTADDVTTEYYYILLGTLTEPDAETHLRTLENWDTGELDTNQGRDNSATGNFDRAFSIAGNGQSITPLLPFNGLTIVAGYALTLFDTAITAIKTTTEFLKQTTEQTTAAFTAWASGAAIATTESISAFVNAKCELLKNIFLRKDVDDETTHTLTMGKAKTDSIESATVNGTVSIGSNVSITGDETVTGSVSVGDTLLTDTIQRKTSGGAISVKDNVAMASGKDMTFNNGKVGTSSFSDDMFTGWGWRIDGAGKATLDSLSVRKFFEVPELRYNRVEVTQGIAWRAPAAGIVKSVTAGTTTQVRTVMDTTSMANLTDVIWDGLGDDVIIYGGKIYSEENAPDITYKAFGILTLNAGEILTINVPSGSNVIIYRTDRNAVEESDELTYISTHNNVSSVEVSIAASGYYILAINDSTCSVSVRTEDTADGYFDLKLEQGEVGSFAYNDICQGIFHNEDGTKNANADDEASFQFAGFCTVYFSVVNVVNVTADNVTYTNGRVYYKLRTGYPVAPQPSMTIVGYGNFTNPERQTSAYSTRTYERKLVNVNDYQISAANIAMHIGQMDGLLADYRGYSAYLNNIYFSGVIRQLDTQGNEIVVLNYRDTYSVSAIYKLHDEVYYDGALWVWKSSTAGNEVPSDSASQWQKVGGKGDAGKGISSQTDYYCLSDSSSSLVNASSWTTAVPTFTLGRYIWKKTITTYSDSTSVTSTPICVQGLTGAVIRPRGVWDSSTAYVVNETWIDVVIYNNLTFKAKQGSTGQAPLVNDNLNSSYWEQFNDFQNVATSVLLAANGYIDVLGSGSIFVGQQDNGTGWYLTEGAIQWKRKTQGNNYVTGVTLKSDGTLECGDSGKLNLAAEQLRCTDKAGNITAWLDELGNFVTAGVQSQLIQSVNNASRFADLFVIVPDASEFYKDFASYDSVSEAQADTAQGFNIYDNDFVYDTDASMVAIAPMATDDSTVTEKGYGNRTIGIAASLDMRASQGVIDVAYHPTYGSSGAMFGIILPCLRTTYEDGAYNYDFVRTPTRMNGESMHYITLQEIKQMVGRQMLIVNSTNDVIAVVLDGISNSASDAVILYPHDSFVFEFVLDTTNTETVSVVTSYGTFTHDVALPVYKWVCKQNEPSVNIQESELTKAKFGEKYI